jgi:subtilisin
MKNDILTPGGRKAMIVSFKPKAKRVKKDVDKTFLFQEHVEPTLKFVDVAKASGFGMPLDHEGLTASDINDPIMPTISAPLTEQEIASLKKDGNVEKVEADGIVYACDAMMGGDQLSGLAGPALGTSAPVATGGPTAQADTIPWGVSAISAPSCWEATQAKGIYVAVIDTGIAPHVDLAGNLLGGISFVPGESYVDQAGHGTHVAGTIAARLNGFGVVGVAPAAYLYAIKVLDHNGSGAWSWLINGLYWMRYNYGWLFDAANMSMGGSSAPSNLEAYINYAAQTTLLCAAAGNSGQQADHNVGFPARYPACIAVGAIDSANNRAPFSSYGPGLDVDICAPGVNILSTVPGNGYGTMSGTSMATPHVTGAAALCRGTHRWQPMSDIRALLEGTAMDLGAAGKDQFFGWGRVNCVGATFSKKK